VIINAVIYTFAPEDADKAAAILRELRDLSRKETGVVAFEVARSNHSPAVFALWEEYQDQAALDAHFASDHFKRLGINGVRLLAKQRTGETCRLLD
jgi:quinol monooxygenase YgiN